MLRFSKNLTQLQVSQAIGINKNTLGCFERNERTPSEKVINKLAEFYEVPTTKITQINNN